MKLSLAKTFHVGDGDDDVDGGWGEDVSEANILVIKASKLSAGAKFLGARRAL